MSQVSATKREKRIAVEALPPSQLEIRQLEFDYTVPAYLESVDPAAYDNVVLVASGTAQTRRRVGRACDPRLSAAARDDGYGARSTPGAGRTHRSVPTPLCSRSGTGEIIVSPLIVSHMLARVALRRELRAVFDELFSSNGCEILFRRIGSDCLAGLLCQSPDRDGKYNLRRSAAGR